MSVFRSSNRDQRLEHELCTLLDAGTSLHTAIQTLWVGRRWGMMTLSASVAAVCSLDAREAKKAAVKATFDVLRGPPDQSAYPSE